MRTTFWLSGIVAGLLALGGIVVAVRLFPDAKTIGNANIVLGFLYLATVVMSRDRVLRLSSLSYIRQTFIQIACVAVTFVGALAGRILFSVGGLALSLQYDPKSAWQFLALVLAIAIPSYAAYEGFWRYSGTVWGGTAEKS